MQNLLKHSRLRKLLNHDYGTGLIYNIWDNDYEASWGDFLTNDAYGFLLDSMTTIFGIGDPSNRVSQNDYGYEYWNMLDFSVNLAHDAQENLFGEIVQYNEFELRAGGGYQNNENYQTNPERFLHLMNTHGYPCAKFEAAPEDPSRMRFPLSGRENKPGSTYPSNDPCSYSTASIREIRVRYAKQAMSDGVTMQYHFVFPLPSINSHA